MTRNSKSSGSLFLSLLLAVVAISACSKPQKPEFQSLDNVELVGASLEGQLVFNGDAVFTNPNGVGLDVTGTRFEVFINERKVADVDQAVSVSARARSDFSLPLEFRVPIEELRSDLRGFLGSLFSSQVVDLRIVGEVRFEVMGVSIGVPFDHEERHEIALGA